MDDLQTSCIVQEPIRVLVVDDQPAVRRGLAMRLALEPDVEVVGEASDGATATALATELRPNVVLMDVEMPGVDGIEATAVLREKVPQSAVVVLTLYDDARTRARAEAAGAAAFVAKHQVEQKLLATMRRVTTTEGKSP